MAEEKDIEMKDVVQSVKELRECVEAKGKDSAEFKEKQKKIEKDLKAYDEKNQKLTMALEAETKAREETKERLDALELSIAKGSPEQKKSYDQFKESEEYKALQTFCQFGEKRMSGEQIKMISDIEKKAVLRTDIDTQGGYMVFPEIENFIIKKITEISAVRSVARVKTISAKSLEIVTRSAIPTAAYEGEAEEGTESNSTYGKETLTANRLSVTIPVTNDQLMNSKFSMESEIFSDVAEAFAQNNGNKFVVGTGSKQPEGFLINPTVVAAARTGATSGSISFDDLFNLMGDLKIGYRPVYTFNRSTLAFLRILKDSNGQYLWQPLPADGDPNNIRGVRYLVFQDMPSIAVGNYPVAIGDFSKGYTIIDRTGMEVIRDNVTRKKEAIIEFTFHKYDGAQVVLPEAIKILEVPA
jgi:HK97 family phage major capsid protein